MLCLDAAGKGGADDFAVIEVYQPPRDFLIRLVAFAGNEDGVAGGGFTQGGICLLYTSRCV